MQSTPTIVNKLEIYTNLHSSYVAPAADAHSTPVLALRDWMHEVQIVTCVRVSRGFIVP